VPGRKAGTVASAGGGFEFAISLTFQWPLSIENRFHCVLDDGDIGKRFEGKQAGFAKVIAVGFRSAAVHGGCDGQQRVRLAEIGNVITGCVGPPRVGRVPGYIFIAGD
jgi:hypothetical protein